MIESGVPDFVSVAWFGIAAPAGTPDAIVKKINTDVAKVLATDDVAKRFAALGATVIGRSSEYMAKFVDSERKRWSGVIKSANIPQVE
jgi:tripartite-type tricarboxylate transporter receptor subunit TctC